MVNPQDDAGEDRGEVEILRPTSGAQMVLARAQIDSSIATAKSFPRDEGESLRKLTKLCTSDEDVAAACFYVFDRGGKRIEGPSVRFTELLASTWKNLQVGARIVDIDLEAGRAVVEAVCQDLENNVLGRAELPVRLTKGKGKDRKVYDDDMVQVALAAGMAKARRNAVLQVVPFALIKPALRAARDVTLGNAQALGDRRAAALQYLAKAGIPEARVLARLGRKAVADVDQEDLLTLKSEIARIKDGEIEAASAFPPVVAGAETARAKAVTEKLTQAPGTKGPAEKAPAPAAATQPAEPAKKKAPEPKAPAPVAPPATATEAPAGLSDEDL